MSLLCSLMERPPHRTYSDLPSLTFVSFGGIGAVCMKQLRLRRLGFCRQRLLGAGAAFRNRVGTMTAFSSPPVMAGPESSTTSDSSRRRRQQGGHRSPARPSLDAEAQTCAMMAMLTLRLMPDLKDAQADVELPPVDAGDVRRRRGRSHEFPLRGRGGLSDFCALLFPAVPIRRTTPVWMAATHNQASA